MLRQIRHTGLAAALCACAAPMAHAADDGWSVIGFAAIMTDNVWEESFVPWETEPLESGLVGVGLRRDWQISPRFSTGFEAQAVGHFGIQDHLEFNLPVTVSYYPQGNWSGWLDRLGFGIGLSYATKIPQTEVDRDGASQRTLLYWMAELGFSGPDDRTEYVFRIHHRSDAYGLFETDSGSNALAVGIRRRF